MEARAKCLAFEYSEPLVEVRFGFYARIDDPVSQIGDHASLLGKRLCRPAGRFMSDPDQGELAALPLAIITMESARDCFRKLADDEVDVVRMVKPDATGMIRSMGLAGQVKEIETLESTRMLYAVAPRANASGRAHIDLINRGLEALMISGSWFEVVASHHSERLAHSN